MGEMNFKNRGELVYETLKQEILDLRLKPGQMISEMIYASALGCPEHRCVTRSGFCRSRDLQRPFPTAAPM